jgi:benzodiazapine receptor
MTKILTYFQKFRFHIIGVSACLLLGMISGYVSGGSQSLWYINLQKPSFNPPGWIFGPVWTLLYIMIGIVFANLWNNRINNRVLLFIFAMQFTLNIFWSPLFFKFQRIDLAFFDISLLLISLICFIAVALFQKKKKIAALFFPYVLWVSFAWVLNLSILILN